LINQSQANKKQPQAKKTNHRLIKQPQAKNQPQVDKTAAG
jgi:hypothetical protein